MCKAPSVSTQAASVPLSDVKAVDLPGTSDCGHRLPTVHTMWLGPHLSRLEVLTLVSFVTKGHPVVLWAYEEIKTRLPSRITLADAERIFPRSRIRPKQDAEPAIGIGKGSIGG